jgi:electron transfer flavoprotein alpha subunit
MSILVKAEHDNSALTAETLKTVPAAQQIGGDINILDAGHNCHEVAEKASKINAVNKVFVADNIEYEHQLAENVSLLVAELAVDYRSVMALH